jgi:4-hydroxy-tetrahydrodipicolinate reductase
VSGISTSAGRRVGVVLIGFGTVGQHALRLCLQRPWIEVRGIVARSPEKVGREAADLVPGAPAGLVVSGDAEATLAATAPDVALQATTSLLRDVAPQLRLCARHGVDVISTSEELSYAAAQHPDLADELRAAALAGGTAIVGAGVNPGFVFDTLVLTIAGVAWDVRKITGRRILDASVFGRDVQRHLGLGYSAEGFERAVEQDVVWGHIGFPETAGMLCAGMGLELERMDSELVPIMAEHPYVLPEWTIEPGESAGVVQRAVGWVAGEPWVEFDLSLHVSPSEMGWTVRDEIHVAGHHSMSVSVEPGAHAVLTTAARLVNAIPTVVRAAPGLYSPVDLPPVAPWLATELTW